jgi:membrane protein YdbS with pleckstrin-like domain
MPDLFISENRNRKLDRPVSKKRFKEDEKISGLTYPTEKQRHSLPGHSHNPLASYCYFPDKVNFVNKDPEEKVVLMVRKHPITNLKWISISFIMLLAPAFISVLTFFEALSFGYQVVFILVWYLVTFSFIFEEFLRWFFQVNIITDERIIEVDFVNIFYREITDANIDHIEDVTVEVGGGLRTYLHYGDVVIQTASQVPRIQFEAVPNPDRVAKVLRELRIEEEVEKMEGRVR